MSAGAVPSKTPSAAGPVGADGDATRCRASEDAAQQAESSAKQGARRCAHLRGAGALLAGIAHLLSAAPPAAVSPAATPLPVRCRRAKRTVEERAQAAAEHRSERYTGGGPSGSARRCAKNHGLAGVRGKELADVAEELRVFWIEMLRSATEGIEWVLCIALVSPRCAAGAGTATCFVARPGRVLHSVPVRV